jgi:hypothetical protein
MMSRRIEAASPTDYRTAATKFKIILIARRKEIPSQSHSSLPAPHTTRFSLGSDVVAFCGLTQTADQQVRLSFNKITGAARLEPHRE